MQSGGLRNDVDARTCTRTLVPLAKRRVTSCSRRVSLLGAKAAVRGLGGDRVEMHSALDELIHYWEARCFLD